MPQQISALVVGPSVKMPGGIATILRRMKIATSRGSSVSLRLYPSVIRGGKWVKAAWVIGSLVLFPFAAISSDIVFVHAGTHNSWWRKSIYIWLARLLGRRPIIQMHGGNFERFFEDLPAFYQLAVKVTLRRCSCVFVLNERHETFFRLHGAKKIVRVNNFVNQQVADLPQRLRPNAPIRICFVGLLSVDKGVFDLIEALSIVKASGCAFFCEVAGDGPTMPQLRSRIRQLGLDTDVRLLGWIAENHVTELMQRSDIFVLPSYFEAQPLSVLEAMSCGCLVIASLVGDIPRMLEFGLSGITVEPGRPDELAAVLVKTINFFPGQIATRGRQRAMSEFGPDQFIRHLETAVQTVA